MLDYTVTFEEFRDMVKKGFSECYKNLSEKEVDEYINSEEAVQCIKDEYDYDTKLFNKGEITEEQFLIGGVSAITYTLYMLY